MAAYYSALSNTEDRSVTVARFARAARLAAKTSDRERLTILARQAATINSSPALRALADTLVIRYPDEVDGYYFTGLTLVTAGEFIRALTSLERAVAMDSLALTGGRASCWACDAMLQIVSAYQLSDSLPAAERTLRRWMRLQPESPMPWHLLADIHSSAGRAEDAQSALEREAAMSGGRGEGGDLLIRAVHHLYAADFAQADRLLAGEIESRTPSRVTEAQWFIGLSLRFQGRLEEALRAARVIRTEATAMYSRAGTMPRGAVPTQTLPEAQVLFEMGRFRASAALFDSISRWQPREETASQNARARAWAMTHAAGALVAAGDTNGLASRADTIEALGAQSGNARDQRLHHYVRGLLFVARGRDSAAIAELRRSVFSWSYGYTRTNVALAALFMRQRRPREAVAVLQPALRGSIEASNYYVTHTELHDLLGQAWDAVGDAPARDSAAAHFTQAARAWNRADPTFASRISRQRAGARATPARREH
jgi:tetratricopeptide (TPR) repeat protein